MSRHELRAVDLYSAMQISADTGKFVLCIFDLLKKYESLFTINLPNLWVKQHITQSQVALFSQKVTH